MTDGLQGFCQQDKQINFLYLPSVKNFFGYVGDELPMVNEASKSKNKISFNRRK